MTSVAGTFTEKGPSIESADDDFDDNVHQYFTDYQTRKSRLPILLDHLNSKDLKLLFKCSLAAWVMTLLIFINPALKVIGQAVFFGVIVIFIGPPSGVVFINIMIGITIAIGVCLGWAWGVITMKAALATRPTADLQRQLQKLQQASQQLAQNNLQASGQSTYQQIAIYNGVMLDTRVTVTYFCMLSLFIYIMVRVRMAIPKLALVQMFSMIVCDIFLTIAPLLPTFSGTIPRVLIIPAAVATGISIACNILFFPQSTSYVVLDNIQDILKPLNGFIGATLLSSRGSSRQMNVSKLNKTKAEIVQSYQVMEGNLGLLALDVSVGRWSAGDIKSLYQPVRGILGSYITLLQDHILRIQLAEKQENVSSRAKQLQDSGVQPKSGDLHFLHVFELRKQLPQFTTNDYREQALVEFYACSRELNSTLREAVNAILDTCKECNSTRWFGRLSPAQVQVTKEAKIHVLDKLRKHRKECAEKVAKSVWNLYHEKLPAFERPTTGNHTASRATGNSVLILVLEERLQSLSHAVETMLDRIIQLDNQRSQTKFWFPGSLKDAVPWILEKDDENPYDGMGLRRMATTPSPDKPKKSRKSRTKKEQTRSEKDPNTARATLAAMDVPGTPRGSVSRIITDAWSWLRNNDGVYALKIVTVTVALGVIAVNTKTAGFFYREKGLWGLIMAQTGLMPYTADFLYGLLCKVLGTVIGGVTGLAAWYIGAGNGPGNPYGMSAIMAVVIIIGMWLRLFASPAILQGVITFVSTAYLVVSYSWIDTHIPSYGNPGVGYPVFWRRLLLVIIGFGTASIVQLFPRPPSAMRFYRQSLATGLNTIKNQYALLGACRHTKPEDFEEVVEEHALALATTLTALGPQVQLTKFELSTSNIGTATLSQTYQLCMNLNQTVAQLMIYSMRLPENFRARFFRATGALDDKLIADVMALLTLVQHALVNGDPLPAILPGPLMEQTLMAMKQRFEREQLNMSSYDEALFADPAVRKYVAATAAFVQFLGHVDELVLILKTCLGESAYFTTSVAA